MPKTRQQKTEIVSELTQKILDAKSAVFVKFAGLDVAAITDFRKQCRSSKAEYFVAKKTLMKKAMMEAGVENLDTVALSPAELGLVLGYEDEVTAAKVVKGFAQKKENMKMVLGLLLTEKRQLNVSELNVLASIPSRSVLLAQLAGSVAAPLSGLVQVLQGNLRGLVNVLHALKDAKQSRP